MAVTEFCRRTECLRQAHWMRIARLKHACSALASAQHARWTSCAPSTHVRRCQNFLHGMRAWSTPLARLDLTRLFLLLNYLLFVAMAI